MENKDYQKQAGLCYFVMFVSFLATISLTFSGNYTGIAIPVVFMLFSGVRLYMAHESYKVYKSFQRRIQSKPVREQLIYILKRSVGENAYLHYGTPEEFKKFRKYVETLNETDDLFYDFNEFLEKAEKYNRLK